MYDLKDGLTMPQTSPTIRLMREDLWQRRQIKGWESYKPLEGNFLIYHWDRSLSQLVTTFELKI